MRLDVLSAVALQVAVDAAQAKRGVGDDGEQGQACADRMVVRRKTRNPHGRNFPVRLVNAAGGHVTQRKQRASSQMQIAGQSRTGTKDRAG